MTISAEKIKTLQRRVVDKIWKNNFFAIEVVGFAIRKGYIKCNDILTEEETKVFMWKK
jgi:hypothetical protein